MPSRPFATNKRTSRRPLLSLGLACPWSPRGRPAARFVQPPQRCSALVAQSDLLAFAKDADAAERRTKRGK